MSNDPSIRDAILSAMETHEKAAADPAPKAAPEPAPRAEATPAKTETPAQAKAERARDEAGKFAAKPKEDAAAPKEAPEEAAAADEGAEHAAVEPAPETPAKPAVEAIRAPQSLTPAEREMFAKADPVVQQAIVRRERETSIAMNEAAGAKRFEKQFQDVVGPYMPLIRAGSGDPLKTVAGLLNTAHVLQTAPAHQKADLVAQIVKMYGVDIGQLDAALAGAAPAPGQPQAPVFDKEALLREAEQRFTQRFETQAQQQRAAKAQADIAAFEAGHEFFGDVRETMGRLLQAELASDLEEAYKQACGRHPEISRVLAQREASKQAATGAQATQRARAASSSVKSSPATQVSGGNRTAGDRRADVEAAWEAVNGR